MKIVSDTTIFIDTNVLFYSNDALSVFGKQAIHRIGELASANNELAISSQIIREYTHVTLRNALYHKVDLKTSISAVQQNISVFQRDFTILHDSPEILEEWNALLPALTTHKDVFDFNVAATMKIHGISYLLTHNMGDFIKFSPWPTILPLFP